MSRSLQRVVSPSLPSSPPLWFDAERRQAVVKARLATWRSHEWALRATGCVSVGIFLGLTVYWWRQRPSEAGSGFVFFLGVLVILLLVSVLHVVIKIAIKNFLARQIFAKRVTVWFTPNTIAFRSSLYANGVVLSRIWNGVKMVFKFDLTKDHQAQHRLKTLEPDKRGDSQHLELASTLRVLIASENRSSSLRGIPQSNVMRAIPVTEISSLDAERMTMVLAAAAILTATGETRDAKQSTQGIDIDAPQPRGD